MTTDATHTRITSTHPCSLAVFTVYMKGVYSIMERISGKLAPSRDGIRKTYVVNVLETMATITVFATQEVDSWRIHGVSSANKITFHMYWNHHIVPSSGVC